MARAGSEPEEAPLSIVEITTFRIAPGADEADFRRADDAVQTELYSPAPGFVRRTTARSADGEWLVVTLWRSEADADGAVSAGSDPAHPAAVTFAGLVDRSSVVTRRYATLD